MNLQEVRGLIDEIEAKIEEAKETNEEEQQCVRKAHTAAATSAASGKPASAPTKHRGIHQRFQVSIIYRNFLFFFIFFSTPTVRFDWMDSVGDCFFFIIIMICCRTTETSRSFSRSEFIQRRRVSHGRRRRQRRRG